MAKKTKTQFVEAFKELLNSFQSYKEWIIFPLTQEYEDMTKKVNDCFYSHNWFYCVNVWDLKYIYDFIIENEGKNNFKDLLDNFILRRSEKLLFCKENFILYINYQKEKFGNILLELGENYFSGKYYSCVSLGLILINYLYNKIGGIDENKTEEFRKFISDKTKHLNKKGFFTYYNSKFDELFKKTIYKNKINNKKDAENYTEDIVNRHKLFHGWDIDFGTQKNAINILLIIDFLLKFYERKIK